MSSAILYLAIVAIWACVLIPRWLRRDSASVSATVTATATPAVSAPTEFTGAPAEFADRLDDVPGVIPGDLDDAELAELVDAARRGDAARLGEDGFADGRRAGAPGRPSPLEAAESRRRMLAARRRLLGMLVALEAAAVALAVLGLAALWVVLPPTIMLAGYLLLLREAAAADAEHARFEAEAAEAAAARARERERSRREAAARRVAASRPAAERATPVDGVPLAERFAAAPVAADYEDSGRDFAPGLAGKYTPSNAEPDAEFSDAGFSDKEFSDEEPHGYDEIQYRRAVGD